MFFQFKIFVQYINLFLRSLFFSKKNEDLNYLYKNGYVILNQKISILDCKSFEKYKIFDDLEFVFNRNIIDKQELHHLIAKLKDFGVVDLIKKYLGNNLICYDNTVLTLGNEKSSEGAWQPHHDTKGNRIKVYIWLTKYSNQTHPLYYLKGSNLKFKNWTDYSQSRFNINKDKMEKIYGEIGNIILFDTHGIHSHNKESHISRSVVELTFEATGFMNRINENTKKGLEEIQRLSSFRV